MQNKHTIKGHRALQIFVLIGSLMLAPFAQAMLYVYRGPNGEKMVTNIPQHGPGYKLIGKEETVEKVSVFMGRKGPTAADAPLFTGVGTPGPYKRKWVNSSEYDQQIRVFASKYGVDPALVKAVIQVESNFDPDAVSRAGARGLMQLMPGTAAMYSVGLQQIFHPQKNIEAGVRHLAYLKTLFPNNLEYVIAAYNAGENNVKKYSGIPPFPETVDYVQKVKSSHNIFKRVFL